jgi:hypothetical protein
MTQILKGKLEDAFKSACPIAIIVLLISVFLVPPMPAGTVLLFIIGTGLLILGMGLFSLGVDMALMPMGEGVGIQLSKSKKIVIVLIITFLMGMIITVAEPSLQVLARLVSQSIPPNVLVTTVSIGIGFILVVAVLRNLFKIPIGILLIIIYTIVLTLTFFVPSNFIPIAFEAGAVTTGPIIVPFILAMGVGLASIRKDKDSSKEGNFGLVALCTIGPVLMVLILAFFYRPTEVVWESLVIPEAITFREAILPFVIEVPTYVIQVSTAIGAIILCFIVLQIVSRLYEKSELIRIGGGFFITLAGLVSFLVGANVGFVPGGHLLGSKLASSPFSLLLIPLGLILGFYLVTAEPAVHVLKRQVEDITGGAITQKALLNGIAIGMAFATGLTVVRILFGIPIIYLLLPGYVFALSMYFFVPKTFTAIAFDSGGVCSGPMSTTFLLPFTMGISESIGRDQMMFGFGMVVMVAVTPVVVIQIMGLLYNRKVKKGLAVKLE